jgi:hypothetical protein
VFLADLKTLTTEQALGLMDQNTHYLAKPNSGKSVKVSSQSRDMSPYIQVPSLL